MGRREPRQRWLDSVHRGDLAFVADHFDGKPSSLYDLEHMLQIIPVIQPPDV